MGGPTVAYAVLPARAASLQRQHSGVGGVHRAHHLRKIQAAKIALAAPGEQKVNQLLNTKFIRDTYIHCCSILQGFTFIAVFFSSKSPFFFLLSAAFRCIVGFCLHRIDHEDFHTLRLVMQALYISTVLHLFQENYTTFSSFPCLFSSVFKYLSGT